MIRREVHGDNGVCYGMAGPELGPLPMVRLQSADVVQDRVMPVPVKPLSGSLEITVPVREVVAVAFRRARSY